MPEAAAEDADMAMEEARTEEALAATEERRDGLTDAEAVPDGTVAVTPVAV